MVGKITDLPCSRIWNLRAEQAREMAAVSRRCDRRISNCRLWLSIRDSEPKAEILCKKDERSGVKSVTRIERNVI